MGFFCSSVDLPEGDMEMLVESMKAMNAKSDPTEEERKGGSGHIGKMIFSAGTEQLAVVAYAQRRNAMIFLVPTGSRQLSMPSAVRSSAVQHQVCAREGSRPMPIK